MESRHHSFMDFLRGDLTEKRHFYQARVRSLATLVSDSLTDPCLVDLIDVTLACEDVNSMLVEVVKVADVDAKKRVDDSLVQTWKMKFSHKINFLSRL